jgi:DNA-binding transcriptional MerR regulator
MSESKTFTLPEIAKQAGAEYRTLKSWVDRGLIAPSVYSGGGTGRPDLYSERDAEVAVLLTSLRSRGLDMQALQIVAADLKSRRTAECPICHAALALPSKSAADQVRKELEG